MKVRKFSPVSVHFTDNKSEYWFALTGIRILKSVYFILMHINIFQLDEHIAFRDSIANFPIVCTIVKCSSKNLYSQEKYIYMYCYAGIWGKAICSKI